MIIETQRLRTRRLEETDLTQLLELQQNSEVMRYITGRPMTVEEVKQNLARDMEQYTADSPWITVMAITDKASGSFVGTIALYKSQDMHWELGYRLLPVFWGKGYATECVKGVLDFVKVNLKMDCVYGTAACENLASIAVLENAGMTFVRAYYLEEEKTYLEEYKFEAM